MLPPLEETLATTLPPQDTVTIILAPLDLVAPEHNKTGLQVIIGEALETTVFRCLMTLQMTLKAHEQ